MPFEETFFCEKKLLKDLTQDQPDSGGRKKCLRILKVMRSREACFHILTSFHMKTVLFHECEEKPADEMWQPAHLAVRVLDLLDRLREALDGNSLPHYFIPEINLLDAIPEKSRENMRDRLKKICTKEQQFAKFTALKK